MAVVLAACASDTPTPTESADGTASSAPDSSTSASATSASTSSSTTSAPSTTSTASTVDESSTTTSATGVHPFTIEGPDSFVDHVTEALDLLADKSPDAYTDVVAYIEVIRMVDQGSGMVVESKTFLVGEETAYAPGYSAVDQVEWLAGTIVHDACHSRRFHEGLDPRGRDAELDCLQDQAASLALHEDGTFLFEYVDGLIEGIDDPANAYWTDPNRHW